ncbi:MAG TPA: hypothetical protein VLB02_02060 [Candidatus Paceibacterota bacterium]|nr:hypothetical protein [Candidatus Paceibacterota bacterium]
MEQPHFELPLKPEKGASRHEPIKPLEEKEDEPIAYAAIAKEFYEAIRRRAEVQAKESVRKVQAGKSPEHRTLYLPEVHFQNRLIYLLYQKIHDASFSFETATSRLKDELSRLIEKDKKLTDHDREQKQSTLCDDLEKMMRGIESVITVVESRSEVKEAAEEYFIGTSDVLDATKKIDLVEYARTGEEAAIRFIQVKTGTVRKEDIENIAHVHQAYLDSFLPAIQEIVHKDYDTQFKELLEQQGETFTADELAELQKKWNVISMAIAEAGTSAPSAKELCAYIEKNIVGYSNPVSIDDILFFREIVLSKELSQEVAELLDHDFLPVEGQAGLTSYLQTMEEDFEELLERYLQKEGTLDIPTVSFYSTIATPIGTVQERALVNELKRTKPAVKLTGR